jgi:hypothetical protein
MIGFIGTSITISLNYNHLQQLTFGDCITPIPFLPGPRASSLPLWLSCTNDVCLTNAFLLTAPVRLLSMTTSRVRLTELPNELPVITWCGQETEHPFEWFVCCHLQIPCHGNACSRNRCPTAVYSSLTRGMRVYCSNRSLTETLPSNGLFRLSGFISQYIRQQ